MKARIMIVAMMICLVPLSNALSQDTKAQDTKTQDTKTQDTMTIEGEVNLTGIWVHVDGKEGGEAKATEYKDLKEQGDGPGGLYGSARLKLDTDKYFLNFEASDFGYHTQYYQIDGGMWGKFKLNLFYNEIPHNITFDARTPFFKPGEDTLTLIPPITLSTDPALWHTFDYSILRRQYGGGFKVDVMRPFFLDVSFERENRNGIKPIGVSRVTTGAPQDAFELPEPIDYATSNLVVSAGYAKKPLFLSASYFYSDFGNDNNALNVPAAFNAPRAISLPPDNTYHKGTFKGALSLPFNSRFSTNMGFSSGRSETPTVSLIGSAFTGKVDTFNYDVALTTNPLRFLDAKIYYKYYKRDNKSDDPSSVVNIFLDYKITTYGGELGLRLPQNLYLSGGYKYVRTDRNDEGETDPLLVLPSNMDNNFFVDLKWSGLDFLEARAGYERLDRDVHYRTSQSAASPRKLFSYAAQKRDTVKAMLDIFPLENLNFGFEYRFKSADYTDTGLGLKREEGHEVELSADYSLGKIAKLYAYGDFEWTKFWQSHATFPGGLPWEADQMDRSYGYGIGTEVYVIPKKLTLIFQHDYLKSNGNVDFSLTPAMFGTGGLPAFPAANQENIDIGKWDDYSLYSFMLKAVYNISNHWEASLGYRFERFDYNDAQLDNYRFAPTGAVTNTAFLSGAYKDQSYTEHLIFAGITYKF
jgi:MtrB/PioB family decaheme-associated outer membrane protein